MANKLLVERVTLELDGTKKSRIKVDLSIPVKLTEEDIEADRDPQLEKAMEVIKELIQTK